jgi:hypothetical protein
VGEEAPDSKTAPEGAAVYRNIRANLLRLYATSSQPPKTTSPP